MMGMVSDQLSISCVCLSLLEADGNLQGPVIGILYDKFGPRYLIFAGTILHVFGLMMASISHEYYQVLLSQGVCSAIGVSAIFQPGEFATHHMRSNRNTNS